MSDAKNDYIFDPHVGVVSDNPAEVELPILGRPLERFEATVRLLGHLVVERCYRYEMAHNARVPYLNVLRARLAQLRDWQAQIPGVERRLQARTEQHEKKVRIKEALGLAICHIQTGAVPKQQVLTELKATLAEIDDAPAPLPPAA